MDIALTGHLGLIGTHLKERLEKEGHKIVLAIDKQEGKDVSQLEDIQLSGGADIFIHTADFCKINKIIENPKLSHENVNNMYKVLEFCKKNKIPRIIYFSSSRVLSKEKNPYTAGKIYGEELCKAYNDCYGIKYLIVRPSTVYGPILDKTKRLIHLFIVNALLNKDLEIYGDLKTKTLDFTYIDDFVDGVILAIKHDEWNKAYNISGEEEYNVFELAKFIISETKSNSKIKNFDKEIAQPQEVKLNVGEIKEIGYKPRVMLHEGVRKNIKFYKKILEENPDAFNF